jgi:hypothetical protein
MMPVVVEAADGLHKEDVGGSRRTAKVFADYGGAVLFTGRGHQEAVEVDAGLPESRAWRPESM